MIKITDNDFKLFAEEYKKGNIYLLAKTKKNNPYKGQYFIKTQELDEPRRKIKSTSYETTEDKIVSSGDQSAMFQSWNWEGFDFYVLNEKEASPYIKKLIVKTLEGKK
jgi:hypothetical protein